MIRVRCPICDTLMEGHTLSDWPYFPFCSKRCKTIDLGRWLSESHSIPVECPPDGAREDSESDTP